MKPSAIIIDIDGTAAIRGDRDPYDMTRVGEDTPNIAFQQIFLLLSAGKLALEESHFPSGTVRFIFTSGRNESARFQTQLWLEHHYDPTASFGLFMREIGDQRPDDVIKKEFLDHIRRNHRVICAFDDRNKVVDMWRANGVPCFQVAPGDF